MVEITKIREGLWTFPIVLPNNPLKWLNCYVVKGDPKVNDGRNLLIDTGFNKEECLNDLLEGMKALELKPENTDVFLTHAHYDHIGNAKRLEELGCNILMSAVDYRTYSYSEENELKDIIDRVRNEGLPDEIYNLIFNSGFKPLKVSGLFTARLLGEGDILRYGEYEFETVMTPGHSPGHMCLYERDKKIMILGDHVLFDITPNISVWPNVEDSLRDYLTSIEKISHYEVETALPGHRTIPEEKTLAERIEELVCHHESRLAEILDILAVVHEADAYSITKKMTWKINAENWDEFPPRQQFFALGETLAHIDYLLSDGHIIRTENKDGAIRYILKR